MPLLPATFASLFDGLHLYEILLGAFGSIGFLAMIFRILKPSANDGSKPLIGLGVSALMIAFPGVQSFKVSKDSFELNTSTEALRNNPKDAAARAAVQEKVDEIKDRPIADPAVASSLAEAQFELGDAKGAEATADRVLKDNPAAPAAIAVKRRIELARKLPVLTKSLQETPTAKNKAELEVVTQEAAGIKTANPVLIQEVERAQKATALIRLPPPPAKK